MGGSQAHKQNGQKDGGKCCDWIFRKIRYDKWSLVLQMLAGVCCSMTIVVTATGFLNIATSKMIQKQIFKSLNETYLEIQQLRNFKELAINVAGQVEDANYNVMRTLSYQTKLIKGMLEPDKIPAPFGFQTPADFPVTYVDTETFTWQEIKIKFPNIIDTTTLESITHESTLNRPSEMKQFEQVVATHFGSIRSFYNRAYGTNNDVYQINSTFIYAKQDVACEVSLSVYPGSELKYEWINTDKRKSCEEFAILNYYDLKNKDSKYKIQLDTPIIRNYGSKDQLESIVAIIAFNTNSTDPNAGICQIIYQFDKADFGKIISPLVDSQKGNYKEISFWIYAPYYEVTQDPTTKNYRTEKKEPKYNNPLYKNEEAIAMNAELYKMLIDKIDIPEVFPEDLDGTKIWAYSQGIPETAKSENGDTEFYIFLVVKQVDAESAQYQILAELTKSFVQCEVILVVILSVMLTLALLIAWLTGRKITQPIEIMKEFTIRMKQATSKEAKKAVVTDLGKQAYFKDVALQYKNMKDAKKLLREQYEPSRALQTGTSRSKSALFAADLSGVIAVEEVKQSNIQIGQEDAAIEAWIEPADEIEELKKVFFEFLKRWVENEGRQGDVNKPIIYERHKDEKEFKLQLDLREEELARNSMHGLRLLKSGSLDVSYDRNKSKYSMMRKERQEEDQSQTYFKVARPSLTKPLLEELRDRSSGMNQGRQREEFGAIQEEKKAELQSSQQKKRLNQALHQEPGGPFFAINEE